MVLVTFKTITQQSFQLEMEPTKQVGEIKSQLQTEKGENDFPADQMKLIYNGKVLDDSTPFSEVGYDEKKFVVVMVVKKKAPPAETPAPQQPASVPVPTNTPSTDTTTSAPAQATPAPSAPAAVAAPAAEAALTAEQQSSVDALTSMGYPKDQCVAALRAAFWNADRAVEYLLNGIPQGLPDIAAGGGADLNESVEADEGDEMNMDPLSYLSQLPQFQEIRNMARSNPGMIATILQQIAQANPELAQIIQQNPQEFLQFLNSDAPAPGAARGGGAGGGAVPPGSHVVSLTQEEMEAVNRLKGMGFAEQLVIEAYIACDKNEEAAVNYILQRMDEDFGGEA